MCSIEDLQHFSDNMVSCEFHAMYCIYDNMSNDDNDFLVIGSSSNLLNKLKTIDNFLTQGLSIEFILIPPDDKSTNNLNKILQHVIEKFKNGSYDIFKKKSHIKMQYCEDLVNYVKTLKNSYCCQDTIFYTGDEIHEMVHDSISYYESYKNTNER